jgi:replicative DNA helicase
MIDKVALVPDSIDFSAYLAATEGPEAWVPWSDVAEQSVLGSLLLDNTALGEAVRMIDAGSFWLPAHRKIFDAIARIVASGKPADVVTVFETLRDAGDDEAAGGLRYLDELAGSVPSAAHLRRYAEIVADKAVRRAVLHAAQGIAAAVCSAPTADDGLDQVLTKLAAVKRAKPGNEPQAIGHLMAARMAHWEGLEAGETAPGIPTGLRPLDQALGGGIKAGKVMVLAARPSVGKTSLATQILLHVATQGHACLMLSQEMTGGELMDRAAAHLGGVPLDRLTTGGFKDDDWSAVVDVAERTKALRVFIDDQPALSLLEIRAKARQVQRRHGLALVVVDYLQLCSSAGAADKRHHQIEQISRGMKAMAKELDVCVLLLSQLNRVSEGGEPELHHLKESGSIEEDADVAVLLHPMGNEGDGRLLVLAKVAKNRGGRRGRIALAFDGRTQRWSTSSGDVSSKRGGGVA